MRVLRVITLIFLLLTGIRTQAQVTMLLERPGTIKYYMYQKDDRISIMYKKGGEGFRDAGKITAIDDSTVQINGINRYNFKDITAVYRERILVKIFSKTAMVFGAGYLGLTIVNRSLNAEKPVVAPGAVFVGGSAMVFGGMLSVFNQRRFVMGENWRLRTIDLSIIRPGMQK